MPQHAISTSTSRSPFRRGGRTRGIHVDGAQQFLVSVLVPRRGRRTTDDPRSPSAQASYAQHQDGAHPRPREWRQRRDAQKILFLVIRYCRDEFGCRSTGVVTSSDRAAVMDEA
jgi:hypothetical protein